MGKKGKQVTFCLKYINQSFKDRYDQNLDKDFLKIKILSGLLENLGTNLALTLYDFISKTYISTYKHSYISL